MTREDIKRALQGEDTRFGEYVRSRSSVYGQGRSELDELKRRNEYEEAKRKRPSKDEPKRKAARDESKDAEDGQKKLPLENETKKGNDYNFFADSYRTFVGGKNQTEIDNALGELKYNLPVFKYSSDMLSSKEVQSDEDLYKAARFAREMQSNAKAQALFQKNEELSAEQARLKSLYESGDKSVSAAFINNEPWNPESKGKTIYSLTGAVQQGEGPSFLEKADMMMGASHGYAEWEQMKGMVSGLFRTVGTSLVAAAVAPVISVMGKVSLGNAVGNILGGLTLKTAADVAIDKPVDLISNLSDATRFSMGYVPAVAGGLIGAGVNKFMPSGDVRQGYIDIDDSLVPEDTKYAYSKYKDLIKNWSKVGGDFDGTIPSIDDVLDGKESLHSYTGEKVGKFDSVLAKKTKDAQESIKTDLNDLRMWGAPSEYATKKVEENDWYWGKMLNTSGMSMSEFEGQVGLIALNSAISLATKKPTIGTKLLSSLALTGANAAFAVRSRDSEFFSQFSQAFNEKQDAILGENAISKMSYEELLSHISEPKETMDKVMSQFGKYDKSQERHKRETLEMLIRTGIVKSDIPGINEAAVAASDGSDELARQYRSMIYSDMGQNGLMLASLMPIKGGIPKAMQGLAKSTSDYYKNLSLSSFIRNNRAGRVLGKTAQLASEVGWEAFVDEPLFEEIPQTMMDMKFKEGSLKENAGIFGSYLDKNKTISTGAKALFGLSGDERYDKNAELLDTYWSTVMSVAFMGAGRNVISSPAHIKELNRSFNADKLFDSVIEPGIKTSAFKAKASAYIGAVKNGQFDFVIENLKELQKNPPEGYTAEDITNEIKLAKRIASIADSKFVREYAKKSGGYGSEDHLLLTSLISDHENAAREGYLESRTANEAEANLLANFDETTFSKLVTSINTTREDADKISTGAAIGIAMLRNKLAAIATISVNDPLESKASKIKSNLITRAASDDLGSVSSNLIDALLNAKLITEEQGAELLKIENSKDLSDAIDEFVPIELNDDIKDMAYGLVSSYGAQYEEHMASILRGDQTLYNREKDTKVDRFHDVDELLDMHRKSLESNEKEQRVLEAAETKREEKKREAKTKPETTVVAEPVVEPIVVELESLEPKWEIPSAPEIVEYESLESAPEVETEQVPPLDETDIPPLTEADLNSSVNRAEELLADDNFDPFSDYDKEEEAAKQAADNQEEQAPTQGITNNGTIYPVLDLSKIDTDNFIYVTHQTDIVGLEQILSRGFDIRNGLNGTSLFGNTESIQSQMDSINSGHGHRGASRMIVFAFPKSKFGNVRQLDEISDMLIDEGIFSIPGQYVFGVFTENNKPITQEAAPQKSKQDELKEKLNARLAHLADVATDVLGSKMNATGKQYSSKDFLPAMTGVLEVIMELGYTSFVDVVSNASDAMKGNAVLAGLIDRISPKQWRAAYNSAADFAEGTQSEEEVIAYSNDDVKAIVAGTYKKEEEIDINEDLEDLNQPEKTEEEENKEASKEISEIVKGAAAISIAMEKEDSSDFVNIDDEAPGTIDEDKVSVRFGRLPHTLFTSNPEIIKWLKTPKALEGATFEIEISTIPFDKVPQSRKDAGDYIPFDINNPNSWNEAAIFVKIKDKNGVVRPLNISFHNIAVNSMFEDSDGNMYPKFNEQDIADLVDFRNKIIALYAESLANGSNKELVVSGVSIGRAKIKLNRKNGKPVQRSLSKIKGLIEGFNGDFSTINNNTLSLAYGRGWRGNFTVVGIDGVIGDTDEQNSGSMFAVKIDPVLGTKRKIKLNKRRFSEDKDTAEFIYKLLIDWNMSKGELALDRDGNVVLAGDGASNRLGISAEGLLSKIVNFGKRTQINKKDLPMLTHLLPKQFYVEGNSLYLGEAKFDISNPAGISPEIKAQIIDYIKNNFNWSINAHDLWNQTGANRKVADVFSGITDYFRSNPEAKSIKFFEGMEIKREDLGLTWEAWIVKYDKLISDVADDIFESPYTFLNDVELADRMDKPTIKKVAKKKTDAKEAALEPVSDTQKADVVETSTNTQKSLESPENGLKSDASEQVSGKKKFKKRTSGDVDKISDLGVNAVGPTRLSTSHAEEDNLTNSEQAWARKRISSLIEISDTEIEMENGDIAMGVANILKNIITLFSGAERGTAYHEAFHIVSLGLIPRNRRMMIYDSVRRTIPSLSDATNKDIEEYLAEEFRVWRETNKIGIKIPMLRSVFRKFSNLFTGMKSANKSDINRLFEDIEYGIFKNKKGPKAKSEQSKFFTRFYVDGAARTLKSKGFNAINTLDMQYEVAKGLAFSFIELSGVEKVSDIRNMSKDVLYDSILAEYEYMEENGMEDTLKYKIYEDILDKFDEEIVPLINKELSSFGIAPAVFDVDGNEIEDNDKDIVSNEIAKHTVESYKVPKSDNIPMEVKFFLWTIPQKEKNADGVVVDKFNPLTGFKLFYDQTTSWVTVASDLGHLKSYTEMRNKIYSLGVVSGNLFYRSVLDKLDNSSDRFKTAFFAAVKCHRHDFASIAFTGDKNGNMAEADRRLRVIESKATTAKITKPKEWGENMMSIGFLFSDSVDGPVFNKANAESIIARHKALVSFAGRLTNPLEAEKITDEQITAAINEYIDIFNKIGISINDATIDEIIKHSYPNASRKNAIASLITQSKPEHPSFVLTNIITDLVKNDGKLIVNRKEKVDRKEIYKSQKSTGFIAMMYFKANPNITETTSTGADGAKVYEISLPNYVTETAERISTDTEYRDKVMQSSFASGRIGGAAFEGDRTTVGGSIVLDQLQSGESKGLKVKTFLKFYEDNSGDKGRDYFALSPMEDYMMKMAATNSGYMLCPTMADKKSWYMFAGIKMPSFSVSKQEGTPIAVDMNSLKDGLVRQSITFPTKTVAIFNGYFEAEYLAMQDAWSAWKVAMGNKNKLEQTYHYGGFSQRGANKYTTKGKWNSGLGNGMKFRHFDEISIDIKGDGSFVNLNEYQEELIDQYGVINGMTRFFEEMDSKIFNASNETKFQIMNATLANSISRELKWLVKNGAITVQHKKNGVFYKNKKLDKSIFKDTRAYFIKQSNLNSKESLVSDYADTSAIYNMVAEHMVNTSISTIEFEKIFSKDPAFHKDPDAKIKRLSSILSTGTPCLSETGRSTFVSAELNDNEIPSPNLSEIKSRMIAAHVNERHGDELNMTFNEILEAINSGNMDEINKLSDIKMIMNIVDAQTAGYNKVNETDASVFISPVMYRDILRKLGRWNEDLNEAFDLLESEDMSWMEDSAKYLKVMELALNPLKMIYYGDKFSNGLNIPKLDKMAMFCLFRSVATGANKALYERMNNPEDGASKIDMVAFSSAVKSGNNNPIDFFDKDGNVSNLDKFTEEIQHFEFLRHQLETEAHEEEEVGLATQVQKVAMSNIVSDKVYSNITIGGNKGATGRQLIEEWSNALTEISNRGRNDVENELGIKYEGGVLTFDKKKLYGFLHSEAIKSNMTDDVYETLMKAAEPNSRITLQAMADRDWIESKLVSFIMKKTLDVNTPGGAFIQMSTFGINTLTDSITSEGYKLNGGRKLNYMNADGSMDCVVSLSLFKDVLPEDVKLMSPVKQRDWLLMHNIIGPDSDPAALGYRIPTQGMSSVSSLKIIDVIPKIIGDTIILPTEFTALTGSDFDVDKLYLARYNYAKNPAGRFEKVEFDDNKKSEKNPEKSKWQVNSNAAIQNRLLDVMMAAITEPSSIHETRLPLDATTSVIKDDILPDIDSVTGTGEKRGALMFTSPSYQTDKKVEYSTGKKNLGIMALANTNHIYTQMTNLTINPKQRTAAKHGIFELGGIYGADGMRILDWLSAMINAHVDVAKDPYIIRLGVNEHTVNMVAFLLRAGIGGNAFYFLSQPSLKEAYAEVEEFNGKYEVNKDSVKKLHEVIKDKLQKYRAMAARIDGGKNAQYVESLFVEDKYGRRDMPTGDVLNSRSKLKSGLNKDLSNFDYLLHQILVMETYLELLPYSNELSELVKYSQIETKKQGKSFIANNEFISKVNSLILDDDNGTSVFSGVRNYYESTPLMARLRNSSGLIVGISRGLLFRTSRQVLSILNKVNILAGREGFDNSKFMHGVSRYVETAIKDSFYRKYAEQNDIDINSLFFGEDTVAKELFHIKSAINNGHLPGYENNVFLKVLSYTMHSKSEESYPDHVTIDSSAKDDKNIQEKIKYYFSELLNPILEDESQEGLSEQEISALKSRNKDRVMLKDFAKRFILYQFYSTGDNSALNYVKLSEDDRISLEINSGLVDANTGAPIKIALYDFIDDVLTELNELSYEHTPGVALQNDVKFLEDLFISRWWDNELVPTTTAYKVRKGQFDEDGHPLVDQKPKKMSTKKMLGIEYELEFIDTAARPIGSTSDGKHPVFKPFVKIIKTGTNGRQFEILYKYIGNSTRSNAKGDVSIKPVYVAVDKKGSKASGLALIESNSKTSVIKTNELPQSNINSSIFSKEAGFDKVSWFDMFMGLEDKFVESLGASTVDKAVTNAIDNNSYSMSYLDNAIEDAGITDSARIASMREEFARGILSRFNELNLPDNTIAQEDRESALEELKTSAEAYLGQFIRKVEMQPSNNARSINIYAGTGENANLSNLAIRPFTLPTGSSRLNMIKGDISFTSVEQAFQLAKYTYTGNVRDDGSWQPQMLSGGGFGNEMSKEDDEFNWKLAGQIQNSKNPAEAKALGRQFKHLDVDRWNKASSSIMKELLLESFKQNPDALQELLATGNAILTHTQDKGKWSTEFPRLLMEVRDELNADLTTEAEGEQDLTNINESSTLTGYQGRKSDVADNREYNFYSTSEEEARDYGSNVSKKRISLNNFLFKTELLPNGTSVYTEAYDKIYKAFQEKYGSPFDILNNGAPEKIELMNKFFEMVREAGFSGYTEIRKNNNFSQSDNRYIVTFNQKSTAKSISIASEFTNHSGGAYGADTFWDQIGREYGVTDNRHYRQEDNKSLSQALRNKKVEATVLTTEQMDKARTEIEKLLGKKYPDTKEGNLQVRNYYQVSNADAVFAIAKISGDAKFNSGTVFGGTNTAVQLGVQLGKPVYVWDVTSEQWMRFVPEMRKDDKIVGKFVPTSTPMLTKNFAGVGTRDIENYNTLNKTTNQWEPRKEYLGIEKENAAKQAIRDVFENTFKNQENTTASEEEHESTIKSIEGKQESLSKQDQETVNEVFNDGGKPKILIASETSDPVFHVKKIKEIVANRKTNGVNAMYLITKHDGLPLKELAELKIPKFYHFSITTLGGTKYEPGVMKYDDLLDRIETFIKEGLLNPNLITVRIDPIIPGVTNFDDVERVIKRASEMGIRQIKFSVMDSYSGSKNDRFIVAKMKELGYDFAAYKTNDNIKFSAKQEIIDELSVKMRDLCKKYGIRQLSSCAEKVNVDGVQKLGCLNVQSINAAMGRTDVTHVQGNQRQDCSCYGNKVDALRYNDKCASSCVYCYAGHNSVVSLKYYNEDGSLKVNDFTKTSNTEQAIIEPEVTQERFTEFGTTYAFGFVDGKMTSAMYQQGNGEFNNMNMLSAEKAYSRLKSKSENAVVSEVTPDTPSEADINLFGKDIDLSKIGIPYQLNDEQEAALKAIEAWVKDKTITTPFSLLGSAGSGKTSITRVLINALSNAEITYQLLAPTHRAKGVLSRATGKKAKTYHAYFQLVPEAREVGMKLEFGGATNYESNVDLYIIDEVSLISDKSVDEILKVAEATGAKVLFIGDHAQLYPVGNTDAKGMPKQSIGLESPTSIVLNKVMRVANGNPLADVLSIMRMYQAPGLMNINGTEYNFTDQSKAIFSKRDAFNDQGGVVFVGEADRAKAVEQFVDMFFTSEDYSKDVNFAKILAFRNDVIDSMNAYVRAKLGKKGLIEVGEQVIGYSQIKAGKVDLVANDDEYVVDSIGAPREITSYAVPGVTLKVVPIEIRMTTGASAGGVFNLLTDYSEENMLAIRAAILKRKQEISNMDYQEKREANRNFFIALTKDFITLKPIKNSLTDNENASNNLKDRTIGFTYASTVHKAQGGEYQNVLVLDSDLRGIDKNFDGLIYRKALYTAVSRARRTATVITNTKKLNSEKKQVSADGTKIPESFKPNNSLIGNERPSDKC